MINFILKLWNSVFFYLLTYLMEKTYFDFFRFSSHFALPCYLLTSKIELVAHFSHTTKSFEGINTLLLFFYTIIFFVGARNIFQMVFYTSIGL